MRTYGLAGALLVVSLAAGAHEPDRDAAGTAATPAFDLYKGVAGNVLETVPMDPEARVALQRANAVIGTPLSARSVAVLLGVSNPVLMVGGLVWGIWSAMNIKPPPADTRWLFPRAERRVGFCSRATSAACQLLTTAEQMAAAPMAPERTVLAGSR